MASISPWAMTPTQALLQKLSFPGGAAWVSEFPSGWNSELDCAPIAWLSFTIYQILIPHPGPQFIAHAAADPLQQVLAMFKEMLLVILVDILGQEIRLQQALAAFQQDP